MCPGVQVNFKLMHARLNSDHYLCNRNNMAILPGHMDTSAETKTGQGFPVSRQDEITRTQPGHAGRFTRTRGHFKPKIATDEAEKRDH